MSTTRTRSRIARTSVLVAAGAMAIALLPSAASAAPPPLPNFSYINCSTNDASTCDQILYSNDAAGAGTAVALTPTADHYQTYSYDVSATGDSWVVGLRHGPVLDDSFDSTTGLVLVHRGTAVGGATTSRVLATTWDATPVISADGSTVWWLSGGALYKFVATYNETTGAISGSTVAVSAPLFKAAPLETAWNLVVSPSGTAAAVLFHNDSVSPTDASVITAHKDRVLAARINTAATATSYFERKYDTTTADKTAPSANTLTFSSDTTLLYDEYQFGGSGTLSGVIATIPASGPKSTVAVANPALDNFYDVRTLDSTYYAWQDSGSGASLASTLGSTTDTAVAPTLESAPRADGVHTYRYVPSTTVPAPLVPASNKAAAHARLTLSTKVAVTGARPAYWGYNLYLQPTVGTTYSEANADEVDRGTLHWAAVGLPTLHNIPTSGSTAFQSGLATYLGYLPPLTRNTYVWWTYPGDYLTAAGVSPKLLITVVPKVGVRVAKSSKGTTVYGGTTRQRGAVILYRVNGTKQTKVATAAIGPTGSYTFGRRKLTKGVYRVVAVADKYWGTAKSVNVKV